MRLGCDGRRRDPVVDAERDHAGTFGLDEFLVERFASRVLREEQHAIGDCEPRARELAVSLPGVARGEVRRVLVADQVLLGDHDPIGERRQEAEVTGVVELERSVDDVGSRHPGRVGVAHELELRHRLEAPSRRLVDAVGHDRRQPDVPGARKCRDDLDHVQLCARHRLRQDPRVDDHRQARERAAGAAQRPRRTRGIAGGRATRRVRRRARRRRARGTGRPPGIAGQTQLPADLRRARRRRDEHTCTDRAGERVAGAAAGNANAPEPPRRSRSFPREARPTQSPTPWPRGCRSTPRLAALRASRRPPRRPRSAARRRPAR